MIIRESEGIILSGACRDQERLWAGLRRSLQALGVLDFQGSHGHILTNMSIQQMNCILIIWIILPKQKQKEQLAQQEQQRQQQRQQRQQQQQQQQQQEEQEQEQEQEQHVNMYSVPLWPFKEGWRHKHPGGWGTALVAECVFPLCLALGRRAHFIMEIVLGCAWESGICRAFCS